LNYDTIAHPLASPLQTTTYTLTMTDSVAPCVLTTSNAITVLVEDCSEMLFSNVMTPNNDDVNDKFTIVNLKPNSNLVIFNRWGRKVFGSSNYDNTWDGEKLSGGVYYYMLTTQKGEVTRGFFHLFK
jgi:gliding motility-associated-like protein